MSLTITSPQQPMLYYVGNNKDEQIKLFSIMKQRGFKQLSIIENLIKLGNCLLFVDDIIEPNIVFSFGTINGFIKIFRIEDDNNLQLVENIINSINWEYGFLNKKSNSFKNEIDIDHLINNVKYDTALKYYSSDIKIESLLFHEIKNEKLIKIIVNAIEKYEKFNCDWDPYDLYSHFEINCIDEDDKQNTMKRLQENIVDGVVYLNYKDAEYISSMYNFKTLFTLDELKWSIDNNFAYGFKIKIDSGDNGDENKKLVSWNYIKSDGKTANLFTLPEYRKRGYSKSVKSKTTLKILENNLTPTTSIMNQNFVSISLNQKLGFKEVDQITSIFYNLKKQ